jgi:hypothetical protein
MKRLQRGAVYCAVSILALALSGCEFVRWVHVMIPDFQSKQVQGVWIWRSSGATATFAHDLQVPVQVVSSPTSGSPNPAVFQTVPDSSGHPQLVVIMAQPDPANPDGITVKMGVGVGKVPSYVRVSTYNAAGESLLSDAEATL